MLSALLAPALKYISAGLLFLTLMLGIAYGIEKRGHAKANQRIIELTELRKADRASYEAAQKQAAAENIAKVQQIEAQHEAITDRISSDYRRDLDRLRAQSRTDQGAAGGSKAPGVPKTPGGADGQKLCVPSDRLLLAQELELKRNALIDWIAEQLKVER